MLQRERGTRTLAVEADVHGGFAAGWTGWGMYNICRTALLGCLGEGMY